MTQITEISKKPEEIQLNESVTKKKGFLKKIIAFALFSALAFYLATISPTITIAWVVVILVLTIYLFVFEIVDIDVAAISIMVILGLSSLLAPIMGLEKGLVNNNQLFESLVSFSAFSGQTSQSTIRSHSICG